MELTAPKSRSLLVYSRWCSLCKSDSSLINDVYRTGIDNSSLWAAAAVSMNTVKYAAAGDVCIVRCTGNHRCVRVPETTRPSQPCMANVSPSSSSSSAAAAAAVATTNCRL